jgi:hypothetical protein
MHRGAERTAGSCWASAAGRARAEAGLACAGPAARRGGARAERAMWAAPRRASACWTLPPARRRHARTSTSAPARSMPRAQAAALPPAELAAARREAGHQAADAAARAAAAVRRPTVPAVARFQSAAKHPEELGATLHFHLQRDVQAMLHPAGKGCTCGAGVQEPATQGGQQRAIAALSTPLTSCGQHLRADVAHRACRRPRHASAQRVSRCASRHAARLCCDLMHFLTGWPARSRPVHSKLRDRCKRWCVTRPGEEPRTTPRPEISGQTDNAGASQAPRGKPRAARQATQQAGIGAQGA